MTNSGGDMPNHSHKEDRRGDAAHAAEGRWILDGAHEKDVEVVAETFYFPLDKGLTARLVAVAQEKGVSADALINTWIRQRLEREGF